MLRCASPSSSISRSIRCSFSGKGSSTPPKLRFGSPRLRCRLCFTDIKDGDGDGTGEENPEEEEEEEDDNGDAKVTAVPMDDVGETIVWFAEFSWFNDGKDKAHGTGVFVPLAFLSPTWVLSISVSPPS